MSCACDIPVRRKQTSFRSSFQFSGKSVTPFPGKINHFSSMEGGVFRVINADKTWRGPLQLKVNFPKDYQTPPAVLSQSSVIFPHQQPTITIALSEDDMNEYKTCTLTLVDDLPPHETVYISYHVFAPMDMI